MNCLFTVIKKGSREWNEEISNGYVEIVKVFDVKTNKAGFPHFLVYEDNQWKYKSAKLYEPVIGGGKMKYIEETRDLFAVPNDYYLAHCISADFGMGRGIVVEFNNRFDTKRKLQTKYPDYINEWHSKRYDGDCILEDRVLNLITKERYFHKPTYKSLTAALMKCREVCLENNIMKLAMPIIGCGLDKLEWSRVSEIIKLVFEKTDIDILVCKF